MKESGMNADKIAITGMACQFPGAENLDAYWQVVKNNKISTRRSSVNAQPADYCRRQLAGGFIRGVDHFDAEFFGISNREAQLMDPQQRLLLQNVWHAIEDAGIAPQSLRGSKTGVFVGAMANDWAARSIADDDNINSHMITGNGLAIIANRVSYHYDFKGPSLSLDSACSSSILAMHYAVQSLRNGDCEYALVAGVNVIATPMLQKFYQRAGIASVKGECHPFSRYSDGIVRGEGVGVVLLQRVAQDTGTYATLAGCTVNHNGQSNGLSAPNRFAQQALLSQTYEQWGISPAEIDYVECHGTGTELGDRIELQALNNVLNVPERQRPCHIGSVKGLIGHTEAAAGIAGVIKLALMLHHGYVPASLYADTPNAILEKNIALKLPPLGFTLEQDSRTLVGLSSFGLGGTNGHLVLQRADARVQPRSEPRQPQLFTLSAPTADTLADQARALSSYLDTHPDCDLAALATESREVKSLLRAKKAWVASTADELQKQLRQFSLSPNTSKKPHALTALYLASPSSAALSFCPSLFNHAPSFRQAIERCDSLFYPLLGHSVISQMFANDAPLSPGQQSYWLPAVFSWNYALSQLWASEGIAPVSVIGEGVGEYVAACLSGLLTLEDAVYLVAQHAEILHLQQVLTCDDFQLESTAPFEKYQQYFHRIPEREPHTPFISCYQGQSVSLLPPLNEWLQLFDEGHAGAEGRQAALQACGSRLVLSTVAAPAERGEIQWVSESDTAKDALRQHLQAVAQLYDHGVLLNLNRGKRGQCRSRLPAYAFQPSSFWLEPVTQASVTRAPASTPESVALRQQDHAGGEFVVTTLARILACEQQAIKGNLRLSEDLGLDSIIVIELIDILNKDLPEKQKLAFTDTLTIVTVDDLINRVTTLMENGKAVAEEKV
ncbi:type I polyketide synthase [Rouxiella badensis]|jgi:acyl transferase domain-containing protein|uniref:Ketosynthase family 3 (KS3) domain-containing protein n=1 Tax=Rouxiella badensis TaxID=1646377 RepID=A0A1X0WH57_9GAMM|nr:type I polyketide synthase [Rouxiella badensis]ORJ26109.1 hypothetical protein BS640_07180 [Rouxiella badensis]